MIQSVPAFTAVGPDGVIDINELRGSIEAARFSACYLTKRLWYELEAVGWQIIPVTVGPAPVRKRWQPDSETRRRIRLLRLGET